MTAVPDRAPRKGEEVLVQIQSLDAKGRGVGQAGEWPALVPGGLPGQEVRALVLRRRKGVTEGRLLAVTRAGPDDVVPRCPHERSCGGCSFQGLAFDAQRQEIARRVRTALAGVGIEAPELEVEAVSEPWHYRNKMEFTFGARRFVEAHEPEDAPRDFALGLHVPRVFDKVLDLSGCAIAFPEATPLLNTVRNLAKAQGLEPWDPRDHVGFLRHLVLRKGEGTGQIMVHLVTSRPDETRMQTFLESLLAAHPEITTVVQTIHSGKASVAKGEEERVLHGPGLIIERLLGLEFEISAQSFFQTNTQAAEGLVLALRELAELKGGEVVHDLCCGAGTLGLLVAGQAAQLEGYEIVPEAVEDARRNAARNGLDNARFIAGDVLELAGSEGGVADLAIVDPPRAGLHKKVVQWLAETGPPRLLYVACNVHAVAPQLADLLAAGYEVTGVRAFDLFPHTPHVECVFRLDRPPKDAPSA